MMARSAFLVINCVLAIALNVGAVRADPAKVRAVVVGVAQYSKLAGEYQLPRAATDADGFAALLTDTLKVPAGNIRKLAGRPTLAEVRKAWAAHLADLKSGEVSVFFFSGHGQEHDKEPHLLLSDYDRPNSQGSIALLSIVEGLKAKGSSATGFFVVDACRKDAGQAGTVPPPAFATSGKGTLLEGTDSFAPVRAPEGTLILYGASTRQIALHDLGPGDNNAYSVYTRSLLAALGQPNRGLHEIAKDARWHTYELALKRKAPDGKPKRHIQVPAYFDDMLERRNALGVKLPAQKLAIPDGSKPGPVIAGASKGVEWACSACPELVAIDPPTETVAVRGGILSGTDGKPPETLKRPYALGKYEVTRDEWRACQIAGKCPVLDEDIFEGDRRPIRGVSWSDANRYIEWLNSIEGLGGGFRLPTEVEWEHAARGGSASEYGPARGTPQLCDYANGADASLKTLLWANLACNDGKARNVATVGSYRPNGYDVHDMLGNVWELVRDCFDNSCASRVAKGGSWRSGPDAMKVTSARALDAHDRRSSVGFRVARDLD